RGDSCDHRGQNPGPVRRRHDDDPLLHRFPFPLQRKNNPAIADVAVADVTDTVCRDISIQFRTRESIRQTP
ncbi:MAG: hypothetical protein ACKPJD_37375, partial [Planctomycetaceae bacterium]